jgi:DNA-binding Lrp family transcriptional regulator
VTSRSPEERDQLLMERLPRTGRIVSMSAHEQLHVFAGGPTGWHGLLQALDDDEVAALDPPPVDRSGPPVTAEPGDRALLDLLALDGRTPYPVLAAGTGSSESAVRRRVEALRATGALFFDLDVPAAVLGYGAEARLWMSVAPGMLAAVGEAVARHPEVTFVAATTGTTNLMAAAVCRTTADLYRYLTERLGALEGIREVETAPVLRVVKRAGAVLPR